MSDIAFDPGGGIMCNQHRRMGATDTENCTLCAREDTEEKARARVLTEVREKIEEAIQQGSDLGLANEMWAIMAIRALFSEGGPLYLGEEAKP